MSLYYGVKCLTCEEFVKLGDQKPDEPMITYLAPLDPVSCACGSSHLYGSSDVVDEQFSFLNPSPE